MSDQSTFMTLPSLVRQAMEQTAGKAGREIPADPYGSITINNCDWLVIRDYIIELKESCNG